jgi:mannose/fructose/N-acetylgalactosamine-specific phosphotransferase system component IIB
MVIEGAKMKTAQVAAGIAFACGAAYSVYSGNTTLVIFFTSLFAVATLAPGLIARISEISVGNFRASFKKRIDGSPALSEEEKHTLKKLVDKADSLEEMLDVLASFALGRKDRLE